MGDSNYTHRSNLESRMVVSGDLRDVGKKNTRNVTSQMTSCSTDKSKLQLKLSKLAVPTLS